MTCVVVETECKHAAVRRRRGFDLTILCMQIWTPGQVVPPGFAIRPLPLDQGGLRGANGFEHFTDLGGQTGEREPRWSADPVLDGSVVWQRRALSNASLFRRISNPSAVQWIAETGMTVDTPQVVNSIVVQVAAFHAGGVEGEEYRVIARVPFDDGTIEDFAIDWTITEDGL